MVLHLSCQGYGIGLELPTTPAEADKTLSILTEGMDGEVPVEISEVSSPIPNLKGYIQCADLRSEADIQKLNTLEEKISGMNRRERRTFSGALDAESVNGLDDVLRIADSLNQYEFIPKVISARELGGWLIENGMLDVHFPEAVRPYLDYAAIGAEYYSSHGGAYTPVGYVKRREAAPELAESGSVRLTLTTAEGEYTLNLPASDERLEQARRILDVENFAQASITGVGFSSPHLDDMLPLDTINVEDANTLALCLQEMEHEDGALMKYCAVLEVEQPGTFTEALNIAMDRDDYELVPEDMDEYGKQVLRRAGADDEIIDTVDGFMDFAGLGELSMKEDGVRRTEFGLVRRLSMPFPEQQQTGQQMI